MAVDTITTELLLSNMKINLEDSTNFSSVASALRSVSVQPFFFIPPRATPAAVIVPGKSDLHHDSVLAHFRRDITVGVYTKVNMTKTGERLLTGTASIESFLSIVDKVRKALDRPEPYGANKPGASYQTQNNIRSVRCTEESSPELVDRGGMVVGPEEEEVAALMVSLIFEYEYIEDRN